MSKYEPRGPVETAAADVRRQHKEILIELQRARYEQALGRKKVHALTREIAEIGLDRLDMRCVDLERELLNAIREWAEESAYGV